MYVFNGDDECEISDKENALRSRTNIKDHYEIT